MARVGDHLNDRASQKERLRRQTGDCVSDRQLQLTNGERAGIAQRDDGAAAAHELIEAAQIVGRQLIRVLGSQRSAAAAGRRLSNRHARIVGEHEDVDLVSEGHLEVFRTDNGEREAVTLEQPPRPSRIHVPAPRFVDADARLADDASGRCRDALGAQRERLNDPILNRIGEAPDRIPDRPTRSADRQHGRALLPGLVQRFERIVLSRVERQNRSCSFDVAGGWHDRRRTGIGVETQSGRTVERRRVLIEAGGIGSRPDVRLGHRAEELHLVAHVGGQRRGHRHHAHVHQQRQRPAGRVVRPLRRSAGVLAQIGIGLRVQDLARHRGELLIGGHNPGAFGKRFAANRCRRRQLPDANAAERQPPQQLHGGDRVALLPGNDVGGRRPGGAERNLIAARPVAIEKQGLLVFRGVLEDGPGGRLHVADGVG